MYPIFSASCVNDSSTISLKVKDTVWNFNERAFALSAGGLVSAKDGANVIGIALNNFHDNYNHIFSGSSITIQIKDIGMWHVNYNSDIIAGDELTTDNNGYARRAKTGDFITAVALSNPTNDNLVRVQIIKAGYKK